MTISLLFHFRFLYYETFVSIHLINLALSINEASHDIFSGRFELLIIDNLLEYVIES